MQTKAFTIRTDDAIKAYLTVIDNFMKLSPKEFNVVSEIAKGGNILTDEVRELLRTKYQLTPKQIANYVFILLKKKVLFRSQNGLMLNNKIAIDNNDDEIIVTIKIVKN